MAIRLTIDGVRIECDTPQEVAVLLRATKPSDKHVLSRPTYQPRTMNNEGLFESPEPSKFNGDYLEFLSAMKEAYPQTVSSQHIASRIGKTLRSIPIIVVGLRAFATKRGVREDVIVRIDPPEGEKGSSYKLTERGLKIFFG